MSGAKPSNCLLENINKLNLSALDLQLQIQQNDEDNAEAYDSDVTADLSANLSQDSVTSDASEVVVTKSAGKVHQLRGIFSPRVNRLNEIALPHNISDLPEFQTAPDYTSDLRLNEHQHKQSLCDRPTSPSRTQSASEDCATNKTPSKHQQQKKRKISSRSDTDYCVNTAADESEVSANNSQLFPLFQRNTTVSPSNMTKSAKNKKMDKKMKGDKMDKNKQGKIQQASMDVEENLDDIQSFENLEVVDVRAVVGLSQNIKETKKEFTTKLEKTKQTISNELGQQLTKMKKDLRAEIDADLQKTLQDQNKTIEEIQTSLAAQKRKNNLLSDLLQHSYELINDLSKRLDQNDMNTAKRSAILSGLYLSENKAEKIYQIEALISDELSVDASVEDAYPLGERDTAPTVIVFETVSMKQRVFKNKHHLKRLTGHQGKPIFLNNYLPSKLNETKRREREIMQQHKDSGDTTLTMESTRKGLRIGSNYYKKKVQAPQPNDLLEMTSQELESTLEIKTCKGPPLKVQDSILVPYSADITDFKTIRQAYHKIRLLNAKAKHVVCAFSLPGAEKYYNQDFVDDEEHGAGRTLLDALVKSDIQNKAVYVVRYCGKEKLGQERLPSYVQSITKLFEKFPRNEILQTPQRVDFHLQQAHEENRKAAAQRRKEKYETKERQPYAPKKQPKRTEEKKQYRRDERLYSQAAKNNHSDDLD